MLGKLDRYMQNNQTELLSHTMFSSVQSLSHVWLFVTPWTVAHQAPLYITNSWSLLKLMSITSVMPSNHLILCRPFSSHLQSFPASGSFPVSQLFTLGGQSIGASASVLPMNTQDWFPLGLIRLISLQSKGFSGVFSSTTIQKHQFISAQPEIGQGRMRNADFCLLQEDSPLIAAGVRRSSVFLAVTDEQSFHLTELGEGMNMDFGSKCFNRFYWILVYFLE